MHNTQVYEIVSQMCQNPEEGRTIQIRERPVVLIFHQHVAELNLCTIHVLSDNEQLRGPSLSNSPVSNDVPDLGRQRVIQFREDRLERRFSSNRTPREQSYRSGVNSIYIVDTKQAK